MLICFCFLRKVVFFSISKTSAEEKGKEGEMKKPGGEEFGKPNAGGPQGGPPQGKMGEKKDKKKEFAFL